MLVAEYYARAGRDAVVEIDGVIVCQPDAAEIDGAADPRGAVDVRAQHLSYLLKDAFAPSHALKIAFSQSAPEDPVLIRHFSPRWRRILRPMSWACESCAALNQLIGRL